MEWLDRVLAEQYQQISVLKSTEEKTILRLRHNTLGVGLICRRLHNDGQVYKKLIGFSHPNLPQVYDAVTDATDCTVLEEFLDGITVHEVLQSGLYSP